MYKDEGCRYLFQASMGIEQKEEARMYRVLSDILCITTFNMRFAVQANSSKMAGIVVLLSVLLIFGKLLYLFILSITPYYDQIRS